MAQEQWTAVDEYLGDLLLGADTSLDKTLQESGSAGLPSIQVSPLQGRFLQLLAQACGARRILELGTLGGYSTIWLARALPNDGRLITVEVNSHHAEIARSNIARAGLIGLVDIRVGKGTEVLEALVKEKTEPFDFIFIDADKTGYPDYLEWSLKLSRVGTVIVADNIVRDGEVADAASKDANVSAVRRFLDRAANDSRLSSTVLQTVGIKGYDGFALLRIVR